MSVKDTDNDGKIRVDLTASTTLVSIEDMRQGEKVCMGLGSWSRKNKLIGDKTMKTIHFSVRKL